jgi:hypothetical protein
MKKTVLVLLLVLLTLSLAIAQKTSVKQTEVTSEQIARLPARQAYVIDLAGGEVFNLAPGMDYSRVRVRTEAGEKPLGNLANRFRTDRNILIGNFDDLAAISFGFPTEIEITRPDRISNASCEKESGTCGCVGKKDCGDLGRSGKCASGTVSCGVWANGPNKGKRGCVCLMKL